MPTQRRGGQAAGAAADEAGDAGALWRELADPWRILLSQLALMAEPFCTPGQRAALRRLPFGKEAGDLDATNPPRAEPAAVAPPVPGHHEAAPR